MSETTAKSNVIDGPWRKLQLVQAKDYEQAVGSMVKLHQMQVNALCDVLESVARSGGDSNVKMTLDICLAILGLPFRARDK